MKIPRFTLGATGGFPQGKGGPPDEGELRCALAVDRPHGLIRVLFGTPVSWLGLPSTEARQLAQMLIEKADDLDRGKS